MELFFALLAAETPKRVVEKLADRLAEEVRPVFFSARSGSASGRQGEAEARFEGALKQANKTILAFLYEHGLSLPGIKLRGAAAALSDRHLMVSSHGAVRGLLYVPKEESLTSYMLFDESPEKSGEPKFFTSLQEGAFPNGGRLVIATSELFQTLDDGFVREALGQPDFAKASRDIKSALRNTRLPVTILSLSSPMPAFANADPEPVKLRGAGASADKAVMAALRPSAQTTTQLPKRPAAAPIVGPDIGELVARALRKVLVFFWRIFRALGLFLWHLVTWIVLLPLKLPRAVIVLAKRDSRAKFFADCVSAPDRCLSAAVLRLNTLPAQNRAHLLLLLAISAIFLHGLGYTFRREFQVREAKAYEASLTELQQVQNEIDAGMIYDSEERSRERLDRMRTLAEALPEKTAAQQKTKADARQSFEAERAKLQHVVVVDKPAVFADLDDASGKPSSMAWFQDKLYVFSSASGRVHIFSSEGAASADPDVSGLIGGVFAAAPAHTGFMLEDASGTMTYWNPDTEETTRYPELFSLDAPFLYFQGRLYAANADGTVNRRSVATRNLGTTADLLRGAPSSPSGLAVDGYVYLLYPDGSTQKYLKGALVQEYNSASIEPVPAGAVSLWASQDSGKLVFADLGGDRAYVVDKTTGRLLSQLTAPEFKDLRAVTVDDKGNNVYILAGDGKIYSVPIQ